MNAINTERLEFLAMLPMLLNSSLDAKKVLSIAISKARKILDAEAATIFTVEPGGNELTFWGLEGGSETLLEGKKIPLGEGIVGWVVREQRSVNIPDVANDKRFFKDVDREASFGTRNILCSPLTAGSNVRLGAIQVLNSKSKTGFGEADLDFLDRFSHQLAFALYNARLYGDLVEKSKTLAILDKRKNEAMAIIAHEFRTPLAIIQGAGEMLAQDRIKDAAAHKRMADALRKGVERLTRLVARVKDFSVVSTESLQIEKRELDLESLFERLKSHFQDILKKRGLNLEVTRDPEAKAIMADEALVFLVFKELLANAIRFTPDGGNIWLEASAGLGLVKFCVRDSGIGIDPSQLEIIFEKFYEVGDALKHTSGEYEFKSAGLGLGLAMAKAALSAHGATIDTQSVLGQGTSFSFELVSAKR